MFVLLLGLLFTFTPADSTNTPDACTERGPGVSPINWFSIQEMWTEDPPAPTDTIRSHLSKIRAVRNCFMNFDRSVLSRSNLNEFMTTYNREAALLSGLRRFTEAYEVFQEGRSYLRSHPRSDSLESLRKKWMSRLHQDQGYLYYMLGELSASIEHYLKAYETAPEANTRKRVELLISVGILHQRTQDYRAARYYYQGAERLFRDSDLSPETHSTQRARLLSIRADLLLEKTLNTSFSRAPLKQARKLNEKARALVKPGTERYALSSMSLSETLGYLGNFDRAYRLNEEVRRYARTHDDRNLRGFALLKLGILHVQTENWTRADSALHDALSLAENLGDLDQQRRTLRALGRLHELQQEWATAEKYYRKGIDVIEEYRSSLTSSQWSMTAFAQWRDVYRGLVRTLLAQERHRDALQILDQTRARHLQDLRTQAHVSEQLPPDQRVRLDSLTRALTTVRNQLGRSPPIHRETTLRNREATLMAARQQILQIDSTASRPSVEVISEALDRQNRALVSYFIDDPWPVYDRSPRSAAFVLTGDTLRTVPLPGLTQDSVRAQVEAISPLFSSRGKPNHSNAMHFDLQPLQTLYDAVYAPAAEHLPENRPLTVIPDGPLFHLPFSMLVASMPGGRFAPSEARYVLHERPTSLELASSLVADTSRQTYAWSKFDPQIAAYGVSTFDTLTTGSSPFQTVLPKSVERSSVRLPALPGVKRELEALRSTVPNTHIALNENATETAFRRDARRAGVLHIASHAFVNASTPLQNAILLRPDRSDPHHEGGSSPGLRPDRSDPDREGRSSFRLRPDRGDSGRPGRSGAGTPADSASPTGDDGVLFLHELQGQRHQIPMVVLSGCNTAKGTLRGGEGMEGLQYAFRAMGAQSTVSTLWPLADAASVDLMRSFYQHLQDGLSKDRALRQAQLTYLETHPQKSSPFFWAPPALYGSPTPLPLESPSLLPTWAWWLLYLLGLFVLAGVLWWVRERRLLPSGGSHPTR